MRNREIADLFREIASILEIRGENPFRIRAYQRAAQNIEDLAEDIAGVSERGELEEIPGIGKDLAQKIGEILQTGTLQKLKELKRETPGELVEMIRIPGLGPKTVKLLYDRLKISSIDELEKKAREGELAGLPGIKKKTEENILQGIALLRQGMERTPLGMILPLSREIMEYVREGAKVDRIEVAGSLRRYRETVKDIDILVSSKKPGRIMEAFVSIPVAEEVLAKGKTKSSIRTRDGIQVDIRVVEKDAFGAALCYFTGSKAHNIRIRDLAVRKGLKINEYGVFRGEKLLGGKKEEEIFRAVGLPYIPPELREDRGEIEAAMEGRLPCLVERTDLKGDLHVHSTYSDGTATLEEIAARAREEKLEWIGVTDHSQSLKIAQGLSVQKLKEKIKSVRKFNEKSEHVRLLCGTEVDIRNDGSLDYPDSLLKELDLVIAAIHSGFKQDEKIITGRITRAMENPNVHIIAHPTGRLLGERGAYAVNMEKLLEQAGRTGTALEINAYPNRMDLNDIYVKAAREKGILLAIGSDAHILDQLAYLNLGISISRRGWLEKGDLLNTLGYEELLKKLKEKT